MARSRVTLDRSPEIESLLDTFCKVTMPLPEPVFLISYRGTILAANAAAHRTVPDLGRSPFLAEIVSESEQQVLRLIRQWLRTGHPTPAGLTLHGHNGKRLRSRCHGARASWLPLPEPIVQMRAIRLDSGDRFISLREQVVSLKREQAAERRTDEALGLVQALAETSTISEIAHLVATMAPRVLSATAALLYLADPPPGTQVLHVKSMDDLPSAAAGHFDTQNLTCDPLRHGDKTLGALVTAYPASSVDLQRRAARRQAVAAQLTQALRLAATSG